MPQGIRILSLDSYRAPSWSWASVNAQIIFRDILEPKTQEKLADIVDTKAATADGKAGVITSGYVEMAGKLLPCGWKKEPSSRDLVFTKGNVQIGRDGWKVRDNLTLREGVMGREDVHTNGLTSNQCFCLPIQFRKTPHVDGQSWNFQQTLHGLVLIATAPGESIPGFRRVGWFMMWDSIAEYFNNWISHSLETQTIFIV